MKHSIGRYAQQADGSVYDKWGGYYISADLWRERMEQGRSERADHDFRLGMRAEESGVPDQWHRVHATCGICGEERLVYHAVSMADLNRGWCIRQTVAGRIRRWLARTA